MNKVTQKELLALLAKAVMAFVYNGGFVELVKLQKQAYELTAYYKGYQYAVLLQVVD